MVVLKFISQLAATLVSNVNRNVIHCENGFFIRLLYYLMLVLQENLARNYVNENYYFVNIIALTLFYVLSIYFVKHFKTTKWAKQCIFLF